jgi:hypothetical protein
LPRDLERLCTALLECRPELRATEAVVRRVLGASCPERESRTRAPAVASPFAFEAELRELTQAYLMTDDDRAVVMWLLGPTGRRKTTLAKRFLEDVQLREEAVVLCGRCDPRESLPFRALDGIIDALSRHLRGMTINEARYLLPRRMDALCKLFPTLGRIQGLLPDRRRRAAPEDETATHALGVAALKELLRRLSVHRPLVLFVDDVQFGDVESAELLAEIFTPPDPPAVLFLASIRSGDETERAAAATFTAPFARVLQLVTRELHLGGARDYVAPAKSL